ncbi:hypothetical protein [Hydrogenimonas urashimensis]|nr:hypothetical protein [Hydrogenimonas urashimensis]
MLLRIFAMFFAILLTIGAAIKQHGDTQENRIEKRQHETITSK